MTHIFGKCFCKVSLEHVRWSLGGFCNW